MQGTAFASPCKTRPDPVIDVITTIRVRCVERMLRASRLPRPSFTCRHVLHIGTLRRAAMTVGVCGDLMPFALRLCGIVIDVSTPRSSRQHIV
ncbi:hypothetical protein VTK56DRAFT_8800 [Thermocarpiscus australiensis]